MARHVSQFSYKSLSQYSVNTQISRQPILREVRQREISKDSKREKREAVMIISDNNNHYNKMIMKVVIEKKEEEEMNIIIINYSHKNLSKK